MWEICISIKKDKEAYKYWMETSTEEIAKNLNCIPFGERVLQYIEKFGYHSKKELENFI